MAIAASAFLLAFLISYAITPLVRALSNWLGFVDRPDGSRKIQARPVALGGGLAIIIAMPFAALLLIYLVGPDITYAMTRWVYDDEFPWSYVGLGAAATILTMAGLVDDAVGMRGSQKLLWQFLAVSLVTGSGLHVVRLGIFNLEFDLWILGSVVTIVWLLASINSFNLIDGVDGLAGSVGVVFSLSLGILALHIGVLIEAIIAFALAGALLGFLRYNFAPASIYLGDTGSMFVGLILGAIAIRCSTKQAATLAFSVPLAIWAIPFFDSLAAVLRRRLTGRSIYTTDRGHFHHVLLTRGLGAGQAVALITGLCTVTSAAAVIGVIYGADWIAIGIVTCVIGVLVLTRVFGHVEFLLLNSQLLGFGRYLATTHNGRLCDSEERRISLQGSRQWEDLWGTLVESTDRFHLVTLTLNLTLPQLNEDFYATWRRHGTHRRELNWSVEIPFLFDQSPVGRLRAAGTQRMEMSEFVDFVESLESQLNHSIHQHIGNQSSRILDHPLDLTPAARRRNDSTLISEKSSK
jgi:UDP-GlcNAc:undecaprenyl-phosphate GlcNAc-1-phosphate transferase